MMELRASERMLLAGFANLQSDAVPMSIAVRMSIGIEAGVRPNPAGTRAAVAEMEGNAVVRMPRQNPCGAAHSTAVILSSTMSAYTVPCSPPVLPTRRSSQALGGCWTYNTALSQVSLVKGLGSFLKPAVIGEAAVENRRIGTKQNL